MGVFQFRKKGLGKLREGGCFFVLFYFEEKNLKTRSKNRAKGKLTISLRDLKVNFRGKLYSIFQTNLEILSSLPNLSDTRFFQEVLLIALGNTKMN